MRQLSSPADLQDYDRWVKEHPEGTLWQSLEWKAYQEALGREVRIYADEVESGKWKVESSALVIIDRTTFGLNTWDIPRGPLGQAEHLLKKIIEQAKSEKCLSLFNSPLDTTFHFPLSTFLSPRTEQPPATRLIDLQQGEEAILSQMKQKGRYNIRVAEKHGVQMRQSDDVEAWGGGAAEAARRDGFTAPPAARYRKFLESLPGAFLLLAYPTPYAQRPTPPIAGLLGTQWNGTGIYYYGASDYEYRNLMAPYLLQWEAMKLCKARGCHTYDLLGISRPTTHDSPSTTHDSWSGITRFKEQFGGTVVEYAPEQQILLKPWANKVLQWKRYILG